jgi:Xaa-Pro aminopeptidase
MKKKEIPENPFSNRLAAFSAKLKRRRIAFALVHGEANLKGLIGFGCDNGCLMVPGDDSAQAEFYTDFRYIPAAKREAPWVKTFDFSKFDARRLTAAAKSCCRQGKVKIGFESSVPASRYLELSKMFARCELVDMERDLLLLRAVKTPAEIAKVAAAAALNDEIWRQVRAEIRPGMTEKDIQKLIRAYMNALGDGEAFETIVCVGANAAECHHVPDGTVWRMGDPLLVDMGVKLDGYCSDMTRCINAPGDIHALVLKANREAVAAVKPGITGKELDAVARKIIRKAGYGKYFGHALGHGVGLEIHEAPVASSRSDNVLKPGMIVTVEPGIYLEGKAGVRIEDLVLVTADGHQVLTSSGRD